MGERDRHVVRKGKEWDEERESGGEAEREIDQYLMKEEKSGIKEESETEAEWGRGRERERERERERRVRR